MKARLGVYEKPPYEKPGAADDQAVRLESVGGYRQQDRMIRAKRQSFDRALFNSYQAAEISPANRPEERHRALINPNVTKQDYDDKILSVGYEHKYHPGDVLIWHGRQGYDTVDSHWLIYLQDLTELAYFKGDIRKCNYYIKWLDEDHIEHGRWFAIRGPVETKINFLQKSGISLDTPNRTLNILLPKDEETEKYFQRYAKFYISDAGNITDKVCWKVTATDTISMPGVMEITAIESYANESEDSEGLVGNLITVPSPTPTSNLIEGPTAIKPKRIYQYSYTGRESGEWKISSVIPVNYTINGKLIEVEWPKTYSGDFTLSFGSENKKIMVESLF